MALDLKIILYTDDTCDNLYLEDTTGLYSTDNSGGYNSPNMAVASVTSVVIVLTVVGVGITYEFTVSSGTITAATVTMDGGSAINILSAMTSTVWPFTDSNPFNLTPSSWDSTLPALEDQVYPVTYTVTGETADNPPEPVIYETTSSYLLTCATCCCVSEQMLSVNINDKAKLVENLIPTAYLAVAGYANEAGNVDKANSYIAKAAAICGNSSNCGCC
jgi:hypothetical protein